MRRKYYKNEESETKYIFRLLSGILGLLFVYFIFVYCVDRRQFWHEMNSYVFPVIGFIVIAICVYLFYLYQVKKKKRDHFNSIIKKINETGFEKNLDKFIVSFGKEKGEGPFWKYRGYTFDWKILDDFRENAIQNNIDIFTKDHREIYDVLKYFIDKKEKNYLNQSFESEITHKFSELSKNGEDFENLIVRLYNSMGYESKRIGGHGDQGGDVIANKNGESLLIQAKFYQGSVGNAAVQQAEAAIKQYGCTRAVVVTTSYFTPEAITLAKANSVELIDKRILKQKLLEFLKEVWQ